MLAGFVMVAVAAASWGTWSLFLRPLGLSPWVTSPLVFAVMGACALPFALRERAPAGGPRWDRVAIALLVGQSLFDALNLVAFFGAMATTTVAIAVLTHYLAPIAIALAAPLVEKTRVRGAGPAAAVALVGLVIVMAPWREPAHGAPLGAALGAGSALCYAGNVLCLRALSARVGATRATAYHALIAALVLAPVPFVVGDGFAGLDLPALARLGAGAATIGAGSGIVFALGLARIGSARAAVLTFAEPLVAVAIGALVWAEPVQPLAALGGALVLGAGVYVARGARPA